MRAMASQVTNVTIVYSTVCSENTKVPHHWPLWGKFNGDRYIPSLKRKCLHFDEIFITGCTGSCQNDNFQCSQWLKFRQNDINFRFSDTQRASDAENVSIWWRHHDSCKLLHHHLCIQGVFIYLYTLTLHRRMLYFLAICRPYPLLGTPDMMLSMIDIWDLVLFDCLHQIWFCHSLPN